MKHNTPALFPLTQTVCGVLFAVTALTACTKAETQAKDSKVTEPTAPSTAPSTNQCSKDTDCKGDRICDKGVCTAPTSPANITTATTKTELKPTVTEQQPTTSITTPPNTPKTETTPKPKLPFVGEKGFNFAGGNGTEESVKINKDGTTIVMINGTQSSEVIYKGKYQNPIPIDGGKYYYRLDGDHHITMLNADKSISKECQDTQGNPKECREELY